MKRMTGLRHVRVNGRDEGAPLMARSSRDCGEGWRVMLDSVGEPRWVMAGLGRGEASRIRPYSKNMLLRLAREIGVLRAAYIVRSAVGNFIHGPQPLVVNMNDRHA